MVTPELTLQYSKKRLQQLKNVKKVMFLDFEKKGKISLTLEHSLTPPVTTLARVRVLY